MTWFLLHFLARRGDVSRCFDNPLASIVMLVQLFSEAFEHSDKRACGLLGLACIRHTVVSFAFVLVHWLTLLALSEAQQR